VEPADGQDLKLSKTLAYMSLDMCALPRLLLDPFDVSW
jgi:hypothetical protein